MPISDPRYLVFLGVCVMLFYLLPPGRSRGYLVLIASYIYYFTFSALFLVLLLAMTAFAYGAGLVIQRARDTRVFRAVVASSLILCLLPMIIMKYLALPNDADATNWIYPVGLSFYTFVSIGYLSDVALDIIDAEEQPVIVGLSCAFFPTVTLGPLLRTSFFPQLQFQQRFDRSRLAAGVTSILLGMTLKLWIADTLAEDVDAVYRNLAASPSLERFAASTIEAFQIYADWLGYSLIAIGSAKLFGVDFPDNFRQPYLSTNMGEFWRSWHIALINWFRDYVFTPVRLQFKPNSPMAIPVATLVTFTLLGAWHTKSWSYVIYGVVNGALVIYSQLTLQRRTMAWETLHIPSFIFKPIRVLATFFVVVLTVPLARADSLADALDIYSSFLSHDLLRDLGSTISGYAGAKTTFPHIDLATDLPLVAIIITADILALLRQKPYVLTVPRLVKVPVYVACGLAIVAHATWLEPVMPFAYFRY